MIRCSQFTCLLLVLLFLVCLINTSSAVGDEKVVVDIKNGLPRESKVGLTLSCGVDPSLGLSVGDHYRLTSKAEEKVECTAQWMPYFTSWDAYDADSDKGHLRNNKTVYWWATKAGFYRSWDGLSHWNKIVDWYTD